MEKSEAIGVTGEGLLMRVASSSLRPLRNEDLEQNSREKVERGIENGGQR